MTYSEILPVASKLSVPQKMDLVVELLKQLKHEWEFHPLKPNTEYHLYTPYNMYGAGKMLMDAFNLSDSEQPDVLDETHFG